MTTTLEPRPIWAGAADKALPPSARWASTVTLPLPIVFAPRYAIAKTLDRLSRRIHNAFDLLWDEIEDIAGRHRREFEDDHDRLRYQVIADFAAEQYTLDTLFSTLGIHEHTVPTLRRWRRFR